MLPPFLAEAKSRPDIVFGVVDAETEPSSREAALDNRPEGKYPYRMKSTEGSAMVTDSHGCTHKSGTIGEALVDPKSKLRRQMDKSATERREATKDWTEQDWLRYIQSSRP